MRKIKSNEEMWTWFDRAEAIWNYYHFAACSTSAHICLTSSSPIHFRVKSVYCYEEFSVSICLVPLYPLSWMGMTRLGWLLGWLKANMVCLSAVHLHFHHQQLSRIYLFLATPPFLHTSYFIFFQTLYSVCLRNWVVSFFYEFFSFICFFLLNACSYQAGFKLDQINYVLKF